MFAKFILSAVEVSMIIFLLTTFNVKQYNKIYIKKRKLILHSLQHFSKNNFHALENVFI